MDIRNKLYEYIDELVADIEDNLVQRASSRFKDYDPDWAGEETDIDYDAAREEFINTTIDYLLKYYDER